MSLRPHFLLTVAYQSSKQKSPLSCLTTHFPDSNFHTTLPFRVFGCVSFVHISKSSWDKLDPRAVKYIFLGYSPTQKGYKCYHSPTHKLYVSKDVTFVETTPFFGSTQAGHQGETSYGDSSDIFFPLPSSQSALQLNADPHSISNQPSHAFNPDPTTSPSPQHSNSLNHGDDQAKFDEQEACQ